MILKFLLIISIILGTTNCTKKKKSVIPLFGILASAEESSQTAKKPEEAQNNSPGSVSISVTPINPTSVKLETSSTSVNDDSTGKQFSVAVVSVTSSTTSNNTNNNSTALNSNTVSNTSSSVATTANTNITFQIKPIEPTVNTNGTNNQSSVVGSTPMANIVAGDSGPFTFQTTRIISIDGRILDQNMNPITQALILVKDTNGKLLTQALTDSNGKIAGSFTVKTSDEKVFIGVSGNEELSNSVAVPLKLNLSDGTTNFTKDITAIGDIILPITNYTPAKITDADGDSIPDFLDAYPNDPTKATKVRVPANGVNTISFEDLFPNAGDADLEDYTLQYYNEEDLNSKGEVVEIRGSYIHLARGAGYSHILKLRLPTSVDINYSSVVTKADGTTVDSGRSSGISEFHPDVAQLSSGLVILERSDYTITQSNTTQSTFKPGYISKIKIKFNTPVAKSVIGEAPYDLFAFVNNTSKEIHLPGKYYIPNCPTGNPSSVSENGKDCYIDKDGFPWVIIMPGSFKWGKGSPYSFNKADFTPYPKFITWYQSGGAIDRDWYNYPLADKIFSLAPSEPLSQLLALKENTSKSDLLAYLLDIKKPSSWVLILTVISGIGVAFILRQRRMNTK